MDSLRFAKRNTLVFFRDKAAVFFSLLGVLIIIGLYVLFLGDIIVKGMGFLGDKARFISDSWIMAGVVSAASITTAMGAYGTIVTDKDGKRIKDFYSSPIARRDIVLGYIISSIAISFILSLLSFIIAEIYILAYGGKLLAFYRYLQILGVIILSVFSSSAMMFFLVSFFNSNNAFATGSTIIGTLVGFIGGIYLPVGNFPQAIQAVIKVFPVSHSVSLLRQLMANDELVTLMSGQGLINYRHSMGIFFEVGGNTLPPFVSVLYLAASAILFFGLSVIKLRRKGRQR